eukprot:scaffold3344_cov138-Isochrysis_galbana.AAC.10
MYCMYSPCTVAVLCRTLTVLSQYWNPYCTCTANSTLEYQYSNSITGQYSDSTIRKKNETFEVGKIGLYCRKSQYRAVQVTVTKQ